MKKPRFVAGLVGPCELRSSFDDMVEAYTEQIKGLAEGGALPPMPQKPQERSTCFEPRGSMFVGALMTCVYGTYLQSADLNEDER